MNRHLAHPEVRPVAESSPMRRGLKEIDRVIGEDLMLEVAESSPMRRGLKAAARSRVARSRSGRRIFPDEEGTERYSGASDAWTPFRVAESSPMRRGLKARSTAPRTSPSSCRRIFPDEEGTESGARSSP